MRLKKVLVAILRWIGRIFLAGLILFLGLIIYLLAARGHHSKQVPGRISPTRQNGEHWYACHPFELRGKREPNGCF